MKAGRRRGNLFLAFSCLVTLSLCFSSLVLNHLQFDASTRRLSIVESLLRESFVKRATKSRAQNEATKGGGSGREAESAGHPHMIDIASLNCGGRGAANEETQKELVYWEDIPSDSHYRSPFKQAGVTKYITFEPDSAGWNNKRMAMETILAMAVAMGRTLVLPPDQRFYMLSEQTGKDGKPQRHHFSFEDFFPLKQIAQEHAGVEIITTEEFLEREALTGRIRNRNGIASFPPGNRTDWNRAADLQSLTLWLRETMHTALWNPNTCMVAFPASTDPQDVNALIQMKSRVDKSGGFPAYTAYIGKSQPVDAPAIERLKENWGGRTDLCIYHKEMQDAQVIHFPHDMQNPGARMLAHFYASLFFQDWRQDLWMKRFMRDHLRYVDEIQCAAARVLAAVRQRSRDRGDTEGNFDSFHVRRGDFSYFYNSTLYEAERIYEISKAEVRENATVYIATSVRERSFFDPLKEHYDVVFLDDFLPLLDGVNTNYYGMIDQLVASRSRAFFGCWLSSFTGYINRIRGYHANRLKSPGYEDGIIPSWYYATEDHRDDMRIYYPLHQSFFKREFPTSWRLIDTGLDERLKTKG